jgi:hypothetical protein
VTCIINTTSRLHSSVKLMAGAAVAAVLALGAYAAPANADEWHGHHHRGEHRSWNGGYYQAPPVVYGSTYGGSYYGYAPNYYPPAVYSPGFGVGLPGLNIGIR